MSKSTCHIGLHGHPRVGVRCDHTPFGCTHIVTALWADSLNEAISQEQLVVLAVRLVGSLELE